MKPCLCCSVCLEDNEPDQCPFKGPTEAMEKSAFQRRVDKQVTGCCLCGSDAHHTDQCTWAE